MKVTNSDIIKSGERELIDTIIGDLDWSMIEKIVKSRHHLKIQDDIDYRQGDLIVHDNQVAYKLDFDVKMTLSVIFDRDGNYLSLSTSDDFEGDESFIPEQGSAEEAGEDSSIPQQLSAEEAAMLEQMDTEENEDAIDLDDVIDPDMEATFSSEDAPAANPESAPSENFSKMASHIAEMISEINDD